MKAMVLQGVCDLMDRKEPLNLCDIPVPKPEPDQILIQVSCCGVCHTELDEIEGRTPPPAYPVVPGHQVVGYVHQVGEKVTRWKKGDRVGVAWLFSTCGKCEFCKSGRENLCPHFKATGRDTNGGYAEYMVVGQDAAYAIPAIFSDEQAAPLLCAGAIGYRSLLLAGLTNGQTLGLSGFGASAHLVLKMARFLYPYSDLYVFARSEQERLFALSLGASWVGDFTDIPPTFCHVIIDTTPVWKPILSSLYYLLPGGRLVINAIRKESIDKVSMATIDFAAQLWMEKEIKSVANITRHNVEEFLKLAARIPIIPQVESYPFLQANEALSDLKEKRLKGAKVLMMH
ncbi:zinc-dependent alcohol dehydrogenase family protein [Xanthocytophaga agilis]|uniref:alcohol dehydrogenase n=1 Tax=Xanthocytophaga agilis TaxID=3048010 RepID=A0AAE3UHV0_9BACT|nr:zinc-dependent alcohol dehydrogenase family protein [Xanthocytophaga agilis]MDJ1506428.1 zinc-dependent alcohol dehydrogenase family protein [Xanthocytophaga agilis]